MMRNGFHISHNLTSTKLPRWPQHVFLYFTFPYLVHIPGQKPPSLSILPLMSDTTSQLQIKSALRICLYALRLACTGLLSQIIHSEAWNPIKIWPLMSVGLTNIPTSQSVPSNSSTKLLHVSQLVSLTSAPFSSASSLKRERPSEEFSILYCHCPPTHLPSALFFPFGFSDDEVFLPPV